ncbi:MAG: hypothetical protein ACE5DI_03915 [Candidatus Micrarchaeia archaeon]
MNNAQKQPAEDYLKAFSMLAIALLFIEILSPAALAQTSTTTTSSADCTVNSLTPQQTKAFWDATFGFIGQEINALTYQQLLQNKAGQFAAQPPNVTVNVDPDSAKMYSVKDIAAVMGRDPAQVAEDLNANVNGTISLREVKAYMAAKPGPAGALERLLGIRPKIEVEKPAYENFKIKLPNQRTLSLKEIFAYEEINKDNDKCLLDHSDIRGRVSYIALLNKDLFIGFDQSSTTANANQHLTSTDTLSALSLNGGGNVVIPKRYLDFAGFVKKWLEWDFIFTFFETGLAFKDKYAIEQHISARKELFEEMGQLKQYSYAGGPATTGYDDVMNALDDKARKFIDNDYLNNLCKGICTTKDRREFNKIFELLLGRTANNFAFGMLWLGPGRFALSAANAISFSSNDKRFADNYLQVYIDRPVGQEFRKVTNWMLSGTAIDLVSDMTGTGIPRAIYKIGPVFLLNQPDIGVSDSVSRQSFTSIGSSVESWQLATYWKGRSAATNFEDIRNRNDYARMSMYANNMTLGAALERREEFSKYYEILLYGAPFLAWKVLKIPDVNSLFLTMGRIAVADIYVTNLVDPLTFKSDEVCDDKEIAKWKNYYRAATAVSQIQNIATLPGTQTFLKNLKTRLYGLRHADELTKISKIGNKVDREKALAKLGEKNIKPVNTIIGSSAPKQLQTFAGRLWEITQYLSPGDIAKMYVSAAGFQYAMRCKDTSYEILAYQSLKEKSKGGISALKDKFKPVGGDSLFNNLSIGKALQGVGNELDKESMSEIINLRTLMEEQSGMVTPSNLYYLHLDGATQEWWGVFDQLEQGGCFRKCIDGNFTAICMTENGVELINKRTGERTLLADKDHSLMSQFMPELATTIIPNTIVSAKMNCGSQTIMQMKSDAHLHASSTCSSIECLVRSLSQLSGIELGSDLSRVLGRVKAIHTDRGLITIDKGTIRFLRTAGTKTKKRVPVVGTEVGSGKVDETEVMEEDSKTSTFAKKESLVGKEERIPSIEAEGAFDRGEIQGEIGTGSVEIHGNGKVTASGYTTSTQGTSDMGNLLSISLERGKIEHDRAGGRLVVALYVVGEVNAPESIKSISVSASKNPDGEGGETPAVRVDNVQPKPGQEEFTENFNRGLDSVQGEGGMQMLETKDTIYYFTKDSSGRPVLRILNKETGEFKDYPITGPLSSDGKTVTVPTEKGPFSFDFSLNDKGQPTINVNGPDGYKDIATLLAARGQNGIIIFDPATGTFRAINGQDISLNRDFATKGLTYVGSPEGIRGIPRDDFLGYRQPVDPDSTGGGLSLLGLPSFPQNTLLAAVMISAILLGAIAIRTRRRV